MLTIGDTLGHYRIDAQLGAGGGGVVFRAHDLHLDRPVAIKLLAKPHGREQDRLRILREARSASALNHPSICTIHEVGEADDRAYIVMEYIDGRPLSALVASGGLALETLTRFASQIAEGLAHAHESGIVHRDLKSANIVITADGRAKILDFGLAARVAPEVEAITRSRETQEEGGRVAGTLAYMAPEVLRAEPATERSDIWAFGVVLYELATGTLPFTGATGFDLCSRILRDPPAPLPASTPPALRAAILRCLAKEPAERYRRAGEVLAVLQTVGGPSRSPERGSDRRAARSIAVLPFKNLANDAADAHLGLGFADATITELSLVRSLLVRPTASILRYQHRTADPIEVGRELGVDALVDGTFQRAGSRLRVTVQLVSATDGRSLWGTKVNTSLDDIFQLQDEVSRQIARALEVELTQADEQRLARGARAAGEVYELYMRGRVLMAHETVDSVNRAIECYEGALALDPAFAPACAGLSDAYARVAFSWVPEGDWYERAQAMCEKTIALDPNLPEGRYVRGRLLWSPQAGFDHAGAMGEFLAAVAARPSLNEGHHWLGILLFHISMLDESIRRLERALAINPDDMIALAHLGYCRYLQNDPEAALAISEDAWRRTPTYWASYQLAIVQLQLGRLDDAERTTDLASRTYPGDVLCYPVRGIIAALGGDARTAAQQIDLTAKNRKSYGHYHHAQYDVACVYAQLGRADEALAWLRDTSRNGFPCYAFFERDRLLEPLRADPRFEALMAELRAECGEYERLYERLRHTRSG